MAFWLRRTDNEPFFWLGKYPVHVTELLLLLHTTAFVVVAICFAANSVSWLPLFQFNSLTALWHGQLWQLITYPFVHSLEFYFLLEMLMLFWFGREMEAHFGTKGFVLFYFSLAIFPVLVLSLLNHYMVTTYHGTNDLHFAIFLAFAMAYPEAELLFGLQAKWVAIALAGLYTLIGLASKNWEGMIMLWTGGGMAAFCVWSPVFANTVDWLENHREREQIAKAQKKQLKQQQEREERERTIDEILDKISEQGMQSLTPHERAALEKASRELTKKEKR